ncbi:glycosyltransferase 87 family protein [Roseomonas sp. 18066]|uniref:glycosyltransferase 87 family protein n=1 Tax=Roseomonas sp. 18066 TaxID=2681412 RepID=UPI00190F3C21|nr:glycosyltransferase 87 family protein [Roseomonas sp. 18066]
MRPPPTPGDACRRAPPIGLLLCGMLLGGLTIAGVALDAPHAVDPVYSERVALLTGILALSGMAYLAAVFLVLRGAAAARGLWWILGLAALLRLLLLLQPPALSSDIYRYVWDGRVQAAGINPYRHIPADPALAPLREPSIYPKINRADYARTIYPPAAQLVFAAVGRVWDGVTGMKLAMLGFEALGMACMLRLLAAAGLPRARILIYAWNPLALWSFASDGHVDAMAVGLIGLALLLRYRGRQGWAGAVLAAAVLVKFLPVVVAPALLRGGRFWRPALAGSALILGLYALYSSAGAQVLGFLPSYGTEEGLADGSGFWLLAGLARLGPLPGWAPPLYLALVAAGFLLALRPLLRAPAGTMEAVTLCRHAGMLMAATMLALSPRYAWYFPWLALPAVLAPSPGLIWLGSAAVLFHIDPWNERFLWRALVFLPALLLFALEFRRGRRGG